MNSEIFKKMEENFLRYTQKYDQNILEIAQEKKLNIGENVLRQILDEAKHRV